MDFEVCSQSSHQPLRHLVGGVRGRGSQARDPASDSYVPLTTHPLSHIITELGDLAVARQQQDEGQDEADEEEEV